MGAPEMLALSLGLSIAAAGVALAGGGLVERLSSDPRLRDRVWAAALVLPVLPPLAIGLLLLTPAPASNAPPVAYGGGVSVDSASLPPTLETGVESAIHLDPVMAAWMTLALAAVLVLTRSAALMLRTRRLARLVGEAEAPDAKIVGLVEAAARDLAMRPPCVRVSQAASEALLAGLFRPHLLLPARLTELVDPATARAVIAHELAHLKRGDHRALWLEEALLALLAVNPLMPVLRARRAAAREEACDALALAGVVAETRRAYAESLIEALRSRAGPRSLPALTFTGAGRKAAMRRLNAVLNPVAPAKRAVRLAALALGAGLATAAGAASVAIAAQREGAPPQAGSTASAGMDFASRLPSASAADYRLFCAAEEGGMERTACSMLLWDAALAEETAAAPAFCAPRGQANLEIIAERGRAAVLTSAPRAGSARDGARRALIAAFPCRGEARTIPAATVARAEASLGAEWERQDGGRSRAESEARRAAYDAATGADYQRMCASRDPGDDGYCAGLLFGTAITEAKSATPAFCAPEYADRAATIRFVEAARAGVAGVPVSADQTPRDVARAGLVRAYPCSAG